MARTRKKSKTGPSRAITPMFLLEETLSKALDVIFPHTTDWIRNKNFRGCNFRPDYRSDSLKLCIEVDGYRHYTKSLIINGDKNKDEIYEGAGYKVVRIPYFIQISSKTISTLFGIKVQWKQEHPHGFVLDEPTCVLPADFCELGVQRFEEDLKKFSSIKSDIMESLRLRKEPAVAVLPTSLRHLLWAPS